MKGSKNQLINTGISVSYSCKISNMICDMFTWNYCYIITYSNHDFTGCQILRHPANFSIRKLHITEQCALLSQSKTNSVCKYYHFITYLNYTYCRGIVCFYLKRVERKLFHNEKILLIRQVVHAIQL